MKNAIRILAVMALVSLTFQVSAQSGSYLDTVYQSYGEAQATASSTEKERVQLIKDEILESFGIEIIDDPDVKSWGEIWITAVKDVLNALPENFRSATKAISLAPSYIPIEVQYCGYQGRDGIVEMCDASMVPTPAYNKAFKEANNRFPQANEKVARFKLILVRGMTYAFQQKNPEIAKKYSQMFTPGDLSTKVYGPGAEENIIIGPGMNKAMIDMAFAVSMYCSSSLSSKFPQRNGFIKEYVMNGQSVSGLGSNLINPEDTSGGDDSGSTEQPGSEPPPEIPEGDYVAVITEVDVGTGTTNLPEEHMHINDEQNIAIGEVFAELPKYFSTCTEAVCFVPTNDTIMAFSSDGYVFITQHSWHKPTFVELTDEARTLRFKSILLREMALRFLYFHPEVTTEWKAEFNQADTLAARVAIVDATVSYRYNPSWLKTLNSARYNFIKTKVMDNVEF